MTKKTATQKTATQETKPKAIYEIRVSRDGVVLPSREYTSRKVALSVAKELNQFGLVAKVFLTKEIV